MENKLHGLNWQYGREILNTNPDKDKEGLVSFNVYDVGKKQLKALGLNENFTLNAPALLEDIDNLDDSK